MTIEQLIALRKRTDSWDQVVLSPADFAALVDAAARASHCCRAPRWKIMEFTHKKYPVALDVSQVASVVEFEDGSGLRGFCEVYLKGANRQCPVLVNGTFAEVCEKLGIPTA